MTTIPTSETVSMVSLNCITPKTRPKTISSKPKILAVSASICFMPSRSSQDARIEAMAKKCRKSHSE